MRIFSRFMILLLRVYRVMLSPDHGWMRLFFPYGACRFHPTCSVYAEGAVRRFGGIKSVRLILSRVSRCHPWNAGGEDPVPEEKS